MRKRRLELLLFVAMAVTMFVASTFLSIALIGDLSTISRPRSGQDEPAWLAHSAALGWGGLAMFSVATVIAVRLRLASWWLIPVSSAPLLYGVFVGLHIRLNTAYVVGASMAGGLTTLIFVPVSVFLIATSAAFIMAASKRNSLSHHLDSRGPHASG